MTSKPISELARFPLKRIAAFRIRRRSRGYWRGSLVGPVAMRASAPFGVLLVLCGKAFSRGG